MNVAIFWDIASCNQYVATPSHLLHAGFLLVWFWTLKMEVIRSSQTSVQIQYTQRYIAEDGNIRNYGRETLKFYTARKCCNKPTGLHGVRAQETTIWIITSEETSSRIFCEACKTSSPLYPFNLSCVIRSNFIGNSALSIVSSGTAGISGKHLQETQ
jgi:hypothetical protein